VARSAITPIERRGEIATIKFEPHEEAVRASHNNPDYIEHHLGIALALEELRWDDSVRVIIITGARDGEFFVTMPVSAYATPAFHERLHQHRRFGVGAPRGPWSTTQGIERTVQALTYIEKPVIARVNGDAYAFGAMVAFGCDLIVAREDAMIADGHLALGEFTDRAGVGHGTPFALGPGDGALAFMPSYMTPPLLKEFLYLGRPYTARQLADMNMINYAVPPDQLDGKVEELATRLLARPGRTLARTKRAVQKHIVAQANLAIDFARASQDLDMWEGTMNRWQPDLSLHPDDPVWGWSGQDPLDGE
jgi:enoyl-CoA hydratase